MPSRLTTVNQLDTKKIGLDKQQWVVWALAGFRQWPEGGVRYAWNTTESWQQNRKIQQNMRLKSFKKITNYKADGNSFLWKCLVNIELKAEAL